MRKIFCEQRPQKHGPKTNEYHWFNANEISTLNLPKVKCDERDKERSEEKETFPKNENKTVTLLQTKNIESGNMQHSSITL